MNNINLIHIEKDDINNEYLYNLAISTADMTFLKKYNIDNLINKLNLKIISCIYGSSNYLNNSSLDDLFNIIKKQCNALNIEENCIYINIKNKIVYYIKEDCNYKNICTGLLFNSVEDLKNSSILNEIKNIDTWILDIIKQTNLEQIYK